MRYVYIVLFVLLLVPVTVSAQAATTTPTPTIPVTATPYQDLDFNDFDVAVPPQYSDDWDHGEVLSDLGLDGDYIIQQAEAVPISAADVRSTELGITDVGDYVAPRSTWTSCSSGYAFAPASLTSITNETRANSLDWNGYINYCKNLTGPACAAAWGQKKVYAYYYNALGKGSYFSVTRVFFSGAPYGANTPPAAGNSSSPIWSVNLMYETGSLRYVTGTAIPTFIPDATPKPGKYFVDKGNIKIPSQIGPEITGSSGRTYITDLSSMAVGNYSLRITVPALLADTLKPKLHVCAVRPQVFSPEYRATQAANLTATARAKLTATAQAQVTRIPSTPVPGGEIWDEQLSRMNRLGEEYLAQCYNNDLAQCELSFYGMGGTTPSNLRSALYVRVYEWSATTGRIGKMIKGYNTLCPRGEWCKLSFADVKKDFPEYSNNKYLIGISCGISFNVVCPPFASPGADWLNFLHWFDSGDQRTSVRSRSVKMFRSPYQGAVSYLTATAYKSQKTATVTRQIMTAVPSFTPRPTISFPPTITLGPPPPTVGGQGAATLTAIARDAATKTAAALSLSQTQNAMRATQTALALSQTQIQATRNAQATAARGTATAVTNATRTVEAAITQVLYITQTHIANNAATAAATLAPGVAATATALALASDGCAVFCFNVNEQTQALEKQAPTVGAGSVIAELARVFVSFENGLKSSPCNGLPASIAGVQLGSGDYQIRDDLANSLCYWRNWFDSNTNIFPMIRVVLAAVMVILIAIMVLRIIRRAIK